MEFLDFFMNYLVMKKQLMIYAIMKIFDDCNKSKIVFFENLLSY